jgi:hypothetical protein
VRILRITALALGLCLPGCKSWGKFWRVYTPGEAKPLYSNAQLWNDYIVADGSALAVRGVSSSAPSGTSMRLNASGAACLSTATGGYGTCIHAGLMRQSVINDKEDCSGISASDALGAFIWVCDASVMPVRLVSVGFNEGKYLSDLIDFDAVAFRPNSVTVVVDGTSYTSPATVWWANAVSNVSVAAYGLTSGIHLMQSNLSLNLVNQADKTALIIRPGVALTSAAGIMVSNNARNFTWYEGTLNMNLTAVTAFSSGAGSYIVATNLKGINGGTSPTFSILGKNSYYRDLRNANSASNSQTALDLAPGGDDNLIESYISTNDEFSMRIRSTNQVILDMTSANTGNGANVNVDFQTGSASSVLLNFTSANNGTAGGIGALRTSDGTNHTLMNIAVANTPNPAYSGAGSTGRQLINLALHSSATPSLLISASTFTYISGVLKLAFGACTTATPDSGVTVACATANASDFSLLTTTLTPANSFVGSVGADDAVNASDSGGLATYATTIDWLNFSNPYRGFGLENAAAFPNALHQRRCTTGPNCRIWDWSLRASDNEYRAVLPVPSGNSTLSHKWSAATQVNCTQPGAVWYSTGTCNFPPFPGTAGTCGTWTGGTTATAACLTTFLRNAYEIVGDSIGNENGLCESNEACIYTPNIASYQGHGALTCIRGPAEYGCASAFVDGTISGVVLYQYATNGY